MKLSLILLVFFAAFTLGLTSCHKDPPPTPSLTVDKTTLAEGTGAFKDTLTITSNVDWNITGVPPYLTFSNTSGSGNGKVYISGLANSDVTSRSVTLTLSGTNVSNVIINFTQSGVAPAFTTDSTSITIAAAQNSKDSFMVLSNVGWTLSGLPSWATANMTSGSGSQKILITANQTNQGDTSRTASLTITPAQGFNLQSKTVVLKQSASDLQVNSFAPLHAQGGATLTISGQGFDINPSNNTVNMNGYQATVTAATSTSLTITVPSKVGTGPIGVKVNNHNVNASSIFTYDWVSVVSTLAGSGTAGFADGTGINAQFNNPFGLAVDPSGNIYVADNGNSRIRKITPSGVVTTFAGSGTAGNADGPGTTAQFFGPVGVAVDGFGTVYVADAANHKIRKINSSAVVSTMAGNGLSGYVDGPGSSAQFNNPYGLTVDPTGNVYVADMMNNVIRQISPAGNVTTFAGSGTHGNADGTGTSAQFYWPTGVTFDGSGNKYIADKINNVIRKITSAGVVTTFAGSGSQGHADGTGTSAQFTFPSGVARDGYGNVFVADYANNLIRMITYSGPVITIAGKTTAGYVDGTGTAAQFNNPTGVAVDSNGNIYVADYLNNRIRKIIVQ